MLKRVVRTPLAALCPPGAVLTTLNPSDKHADVVLSGGNLTASVASGTAYRNVRSTTFKGGIRAAEVTVNSITSGDPGIGFANSSAALNNWGGNDSNSAAVYPSGNTYFGGALEAGATSYVIGSVRLLIINKTAGKWYLKHGSSIEPAGADPAAGTGGFTLPSGDIFLFLGLYDSGDSFTVQFSGTPTIALPTGVVMWDD